MTDRGSRALWTALALSAAVHVAVWIAGPELRFPTADALRADTRVVLLPPMDDPAPPAVEIPPAPEPIERPAEPVAPEEGEGGTPVAEPPPFIPHDVRPRLENAPFIREYLEAFYPPTLRTAGTEARVRLWLFVTREGTVDRARIQSTSGLPAFDSLAVAAAGVMDFRPALSGDQTVGVWVEQWISFRVEPPELAPLAADPPGER